MMSLGRTAYYSRPFSLRSSAIYHLGYADGVDLATVFARLGHSSVRTTADIYSYAIRGKDHAAAQSWDDIMQRSRSETEKSKTVN